MSKTIYKIICKNINVTDSYVGSTSNFNKRKSNHKSACCNIDHRDHNLKIYKIMRNNLGWNNWEIIIIEEQPFENATIRERYWVEQLNSTLNCNIPSRSKQEYKKYYNELHKEDIQEYYKIYYQKSKTSLNNVT